MPRLDNFFDAASSRATLAASGLGHAASERHAAVVAAVADALVRSGASRDLPAAGYYVPGRIEVLGKHTDYAGGDSLTCAVERGFCVLAVPDSGRAVIVSDAGSGASRAFALDDLPREADGWGRYPLAAVQRIAANFGAPASGARVAFLSTLPADAGLSSSSAFIVAVFLALRDVWVVHLGPRYRLALPTPLELADYLGHVENGQTYRALAGAGGVGTFGGSQDHTAILCGQAGQVSRFQYAPTRLRQRVPLPVELTFAVATSGVRAEKGAGALHAYNAASQLAGEVVARWNARSGADVQRMRDLPDSTTAVERALRGRPELIARYRHFRGENAEVVPAAFAAMGRGDWGAFGRLVDRSQALAETLLGNQVPETSALARMARAEGALAASAFGAGFGGAAWALVPASDAGAFADAWISRYRAEYPTRTDAAAFLTRPGPAAFSLDAPYENVRRG